MEFMTGIAFLVGVILLIKDTVKKVNRSKAVQKRLDQSAGSGNSAQQKQAQDAWLNEERKRRQAQAEADARRAAAANSGRKSPQQMMKEELRRNQANTAAKKRDVSVKQQKTAAPAYRESRSDNVRPVTVSADALNYSGSAYSARRYLNVSPLSRKALIDELEAAGYSEADAVSGADSCGADWKEQAVLSATRLLRASAYSRRSMIRELMTDGFTAEEAAFGADRSGADWKEQAVLSAKNELRFYRYSYADLLESLIAEGFTVEEAEYGARKNSL